MTKFQLTRDSLWIDTDHKKTSKFNGMMQYICTAYQHVLKREKWYTAGEFAQEIKQVYSLDNPKNKACFDYLMNLS